MFAFRRRASARKERLDKKDRVYTARKLDQKLGNRKDSSTNQFQQLSPLHLLQHHLHLKIALNLLDSQYHAQLSFVGNHLVARVTSDGLLNQNPQFRNRTSYGWFMASQGPITGDTPIHSTLSSFHWTGVVFGTIVPMPSPVPAVSVVVGVWLCPCATLWVPKKIAKGWTPSHFLPPCPLLLHSTGVLELFHTCAWACWSLLVMLQCYS